MLSWHHQFMHERPFDQSVFDSVAAKSQQHGIFLAMWIYLSIDSMFITTKVSNSFRQADGVSMSKQFRSEKVSYSSGREFRSSAYIHQTDLHS
jgi:hypothetical protein